MTSMGFRFTKSTTVTELFAGLFTYIFVPSGLTAVPNAPGPATTSSFKVKFLML
ncbi:hypothetical protein ACFX4I_22065 [Peribacillus sp. YIM B13472]|uniref:hypothetical protein n=1 Tax=Peribacillus sp. YIM B13472 TaxID=3366297 RepID=UPI0036731A8D